jgi:hypothetical protein
MMQQGLVTPGFLGNEPTYVGAAPAVHSQSGYLVAVAVLLCALVFLKPWASISQHSDLT